MSITRNTTDPTITDLLGRVEELIRINRSLVEQLQTDTTVAGKRKHADFVRKMNSRMTLKETAKLFDVSLLTINRWVKNGYDGIVLVSEKYGHRRMVTHAAAKDFQQRINDNPDIPLSSRKTIRASSLKETTRKVLDELGMKRK